MSSLSVSSSYAFISPNTLFYSLFYFEKLATGQTLYSAHSSAIQKHWIVKPGVDVEETKEPFN